MKKFLSVLILIMSAVMLFAFTACGGSGKPVTSIKVTAPTKTEYYLNEEFDGTGGSILVTYEDGTTETIGLDAEGVTLSELNTSRVGKKTITVTYGGQRDKFSVNVVEKGVTVTFDYNYEGAPAAGTGSAILGGKATKPADPERSGYTFYNWYADKACMILYDFNAPVNSEMTLYAEWKENGATYYDLTYDLNYYGVTPQSYTKIVKSGEKAVAFSNTVTRTEYTFNGWFKDKGCSQSFTAANETITADTTVYAGWTKAKTGSSVYTFEAEQTSLKGKSGPGFSGSATEQGMILTSNSASGNKAVSFLYKKGLTLDFYIASDVKVTDAKITVYVAAEMDGITFNSDEYQVIVNGTPLSFAQVSLPNSLTFTGAITISGVTLEEGANSIVLKTNNNTSLGGTYAGIAPVVDCIKIETSAVLIWDAVKGLPMNY